MKNIQVKHFDSEENQYRSDKLFNPPPHVKDEINEIIRLIKNNTDVKNIVDFGSGNGRLTIPLLKNNFNITAIDISSKSLKKLTSNVSKINKQKQLITSNNLPKKTTIIAGTDILHHVNLVKCFPIFYKHLNNDGLMIFSEPNILNIGWSVFISLFLDWKVEKGIIQINYFNLIKQLKLADFKEIKIIGLFLLPPMIFNKISFLRKLNIFLGDLPILKLFAFRYIITARR